MGRRVRGLVWISAILAIVLASSFPGIAQKEDPKAQQAEELYRQGKDLINQARYEEALTHLREALSIYRELDGRMAEGQTLNVIGIAYNAMGQYMEGLEKFQQARNIAQETGDTLGEIQALNNMGAIYGNLGEYNKAKKQFLEAKDLYKETDNRAGVGKATGNIGIIEYKLGNYKTALKKLQESLEIAREFDDPIEELTRLMNIGVLYYSQGRYELALRKFEAARDIAKTFGEQAQVGMISNIAAVYLELGEYDQAREQFQEALALWEGESTVGKARAEGNLGLVYLKTEKYDQALKQFEKAQSIFESIGDEAAQARGLSHIGLAHKNLGNKEEALKYLQQALDLRREIGDRAGEGNTLNSIGLVLESQGQYEAAEKRFQEALDIAQDMDDRMLKAGSWGNLGFLYEAKGNLDKTIESFEKSIESIESIQSEIHVEVFLTAFANQQVFVYAKLIELLIERGDKGDVASAFNYTERARARSLLNLLGNQQVKLHHGVSDELLLKEQRLRRQLAEMEFGERYETGFAQQKRQNTKTQEERESELKELRAEYEELLHQLKLRHPEYASMVSVDTLKLDQVQRELLDSNTTLIEYFITNKQTFAWVIDQEKVKLVPLEVLRSELEDKIALLRKRIADTSLGNVTSGNLYEMLFAPLREHIDHRNLLIVPHGVLHYLPFAALWDPENERHLLQDYLITYTPSASVQRFILEKRNPDEKHVLAMGNPDGSLPHAEDEVEAVAALYETDPLVGSRATESQLYEQASAVDVLHLAAHGVLEPENPLFSSIKLAKGEQTDGNLEVHEVFGLDLSDANLVVLSACDTARGQRSRGDEVVSLNRAFLYAGTPAVVTTLWKVDDEASGALMENFYSYLQDGKTNTEALRLAQREIMRQDRWESPYYWAAFSLAGDYRGNSALGEIPILKSATTGSPIWLLGMGVAILLFLTVGGYLVRRRQRVS